MRPPSCRQIPIRTAFSKVRFLLCWHPAVVAAGCMLGAAGFLASGLTASAAEASPASAYQAFSDTAEVPDEAKAREALEALRYLLAADPELATAATSSTSSTPAAGGTQLSPELAVQMRASRDRSITQIQQMLGETDAAKNPEQHKQLMDALARTQASYAQLLGETAPPTGAGSSPGAASAPAATGASTGLRIPATGDRQPTLAEALTNLKKMLRDNAPAAAISGFERSDDYTSAAGSAASAAAAAMQKRPMAALAGFLRAHELEPNKPGHLINLAGLTASFGMPRHTLTLLEGAEKLLGAAGSTSANLGGLNIRAVLLTNRGRALVHVKQFARAETVLREAVRLEPNLSEARINLAHALFQQPDEKKQDEAVHTMRFARVRIVKPPAGSPPATPPPTPAPAAPVPGPNAPPDASEAGAEAERIAERAGRRPAHELFDLSRGKQGHLPTIKIPRKLADGHAMWKKIHVLHQDTLARMSSMGERMNELWDLMVQRERAGDMPRISGQRARDIFWYISNAHTEPELHGVFQEYEQAAQDEGNGTFGGQLSNPFASHELEKKMDAIHAGGSLQIEKDLYDATEPYHGTWQGPIHTFETATHRLAKAYYKHTTAIAMHLSDPVHHEYANLLIRTRTLSFFAGYLSALETVARFDYDSVEAWGALYGPGEAEDPGEGEYPESDWCPAALKGEYKVKATFKIFEVSMNCEKVGFQIAAGEWIKAFAEVEETWEGDRSFFFGSAVEAALPGGGPSAEAKSGFFVNVNAKGEITDFGLKSTHSTGVSVGPIGYEREVENTFSVMSVLNNVSF